MTQEKLKAFRLGSINTQLNKAAPLTKKKELREERKRVCFLMSIFPISDVLLVIIKQLCNSKLKNIQYLTGCHPNNAINTETYTCI